MKPKNAKARRAAFIKFFILFLATTGTVVAAVYFNYKVPNSENEYLREQARTSSADMQFQSEFYNELATIREMINQIETTEGPELEYEIRNKLTSLKERIPDKDSTQLQGFHNLVFSMIAELKDYYTLKAEMANIEGGVDDIKQDLLECKQENTRLMLLNDRLKDN